MPTKVGTQTAPGQRGVAVWLDPGLRRGRLFAGMTFVEDLSRRVDAARGDNVKGREFHIFLSRR